MTGERDETMYNYYLINAHQLHYIVGTKQNKNVCTYSWQQTGQINADDGNSNFKSNFSLNVPSFNYQQESKKNKQFSVMCVTYTTSTNIYNTPLPCTYRSEYLAVFVPHQMPSH